MGSYRPGHCNIGRRERRRRGIVAGAAFAVAALIVLAYAGGYLPAPLFAGVFVFLAVGFEWGLQASTAFCVRLALLNRYDFRGEGGTAGTVSDPGAWQDDRVQAAKITGASLLLAAVTTGGLAVVL